MSKSENNQEYSLAENLAHAACCCVATGLFITAIAGGKAKDNIAITVAAEAARAALYKNKTIDITLDRTIIYGIAGLAAAIAVSNAPNIPRAIITGATLGFLGDNLPDMQPER